MSGELLIACATNLRVLQSQRLNYSRTVVYGRPVVAKQTRKPYTYLPHSSIRQSTSVIAFYGYIEIFVLDQNEGGSFFITLCIYCMGISTS